MTIDAKPRSAIRVVNQETVGEAWNRFLLEQGDANFYQRSEWNRINSSHFGHRCHNLAAMDGDRLVGVFPLTEIRSRLFGNILCSMPFVNFGGVSARDDAIRQQLLQAARELADRSKVDFMEIRGFSRLDAELPAATHKISMTLPLAEDPDTIWNNFKSKHRTNIRRVFKDDVSVRSGGEELLDVFYQLMCLSWRSLGTPIYSRRYFAAILDSFGEDIRIFVAYHGNTPIATAFNGHFRDTVEGMWAGGLPEARKLQPNYALYWEMIKDACERGYREYHLGRSSADSGGESFKKKWNAEAKQLYWEYYLPGGGPAPAINVDNPKYALAIKLWRKLPLPLTRLIGPRLARSIP